MDYFSKKGFYVNFLNVYFLNYELLINVCLLTSRKSLIFHRKFRRFLKKKRFIYKNKNKRYLKKKYAYRSFLGISFFLKTLSTHYNLKNVLFKVKRLENRLCNPELSSLWNGVKKYASFSYRRSPYILDLLVASSYVLLGEGSAFLINQVLVKMFSRMSKRQHRRFLLFLKNFFQVICDSDKVCNHLLFGIKFLVSGKLSGKTRSKMFEASVGRVPIQAFCVSIDYSCLTSFTLMGTFGFKLWIAKKKGKSKKAVFGMLRKKLLLMRRFRSESAFVENKKKKFLLFSDRKRGLKVANTSSKARKNLLS